MPPLLFSQVVERNTVAKPFPPRYPVRVVVNELRARGIYAGDVLIVNAAAEPVFVLKVDLASRQGPNLRFQTEIGALPEGGHSEPPQ